MGFYVVFVVTHYPSRINMIDVPEKYDLIFTTELRFVVTKQDCIFLLQELKIMYSTCIELFKYTYLGTWFS